MKKAGKRRIPIYKNKVYMDIIKCMGNEKLRAQEIANRVNKDQSITIRQLNILITKGYVKKEIVKKTKYYCVGWSILGIELLRYYELYIEILFLQKKLI